jgi:lipoprotein signal peptidase
LRNISIINRNFNLIDVISVIGVRLIKVSSLRESKKTAWRNREQGLILTGA